MPSKTFKCNGLRLDFYRPDEVKGIWPDIAPLYKKSIDRSAHGEFTLDDLYQLAINADVAVGIVRDNDNKIVLSLMIEDRKYPHATAINVFALAGSRLDDFMTSLFPMFCEYAIGLGVDWIECQVSPAMARIHQRYGFNTVYQTLRFNLEKTHE